MNIKLELIQSINDLSARGLYVASKWSAEQLNGLNSNLRSSKIADTVTTTTNIEKSSPPIGSNEHIKYLLAKSYFDLKEYRRCVDALQDCKYQLNIFLRCYALYLAIEKRREEENVEHYSLSSLEAAENTGTHGMNSNSNNSNNNNNGPPNEDPMSSTSLDQKSVRETNKALQAYYGNPETYQEFKKLTRFYHKFYNECGATEMDGFNLYLYSILLKRQNDLVTARKVLFESVKRYPCNWSAWSDLSTLCSDFAVFGMQLSVPDHFMKDFFLAHFKLELQQNNESISIYQNLSQTFSNSTYILAQMAIGNYNLRAYDVGEELFEKLIELEPNRLESMDIYSNILYVCDKRAALSMLAHKATKIEKYCPETCCIVGNYYSLRLEHTNAIMYFQRALRLNPKYLSAWTLIGHEFLEVKNVSAAINAYRKAVDINPRDYRAWFGLGQTYQLLKLPLYSLYYFKKATTLRPYDPRMWCAAGGCYEYIDRIPDAIKCYERAEENFDRERVAINKLAKLYQEMQNNEKAAYYYKKNLYHCDNEKIDGQEIIDALLFLANHCKNTNLLNQAEKYCLRLLDYAGPEKEEAKAILIEIHSKR
ncbi:hypothetical protein CYY_005371 [Polysphondylium violaceum]|uniref:Cdc23 domain-containing protein n=1 Tax=Polysphondylium violaceum TaxID=133409 RepID=A0A8J4UZM9_9MYCE|nr:hypothetical protein CYY_005371 [Polysphondylium violaceum]